MWCYLIQNFEGTGNMASLRPLRDSWGGCFELFSTGRLWYARDDCYTMYDEGWQIYAPTPQKRRTSCIFWCMMMPDCDDGWQIKSFDIPHPKIGLELQVQQQAPLVKPSDVFLVGVPGSGTIWLSHILHGLRSDGSSWVSKRLGGWRKRHWRFLRCHLWDEGGTIWEESDFFGSFCIFYLFDLGVWDQYCNCKFVGQQNKLGQRFVTFD